MSNSRLLISLDFELHWGVFDHTALDTSGRKYFNRARDLIPPVLERFDRHGIHATWATVGLLFAKSRRQALEFAPPLRPRYTESLLDPYPLLDTVGKNEEEDPYHFAPSLIERIVETPGQQLGSHTFSHFYALEHGATEAAFAADLHAAQAIAEANFGLRLQSLVFPRNQCAHLHSLKRTDFATFRGNPSPWFWRAASGSDTSLRQKLFRFADHYLPISAHNDEGSEMANASPATVINLPASRFFRPYIPKIDAYGGQRLKVRRILSEMTQAARNGEVYHLWWHPHNLATDPVRNLAAVERILQHYRDLHRRYGMQSVSMEELLPVAS